MKIFIDRMIRFVGLDRVTPHGFRDLWTLILHKARCVGFDAKNANS